MSEIAYIKYPSNQEYEDMICSFSPIIKPTDYNAAICTYPEDRQLVPYKSDESDSSCQDNCLDNQPLFYLDFSEARSPDMSIPSGDTRLFGQLHRLQDNCAFYKTDKSGAYTIGDAGNYQQVHPLEDCAHGRITPGQNNLAELVPILYCRKPLPLLYFEKSPVYVNSRQYERILKLRNKKLEKGIIKGPNYIFERPKSKTYRHESRSQHAKNRQREGNGRFLTKRFDDLPEVQEIVVDKSHLCPKIKRRQT